MAPQEIYQLKVTIKGSKPPIWRRIEVPGDAKLSMLHQILQATMDWSDDHLHQFIAGGIYYGQPNPEFGLDEFDMWDESKYCLSQIAPGEKSRFVYEYDFGDSWKHVIVVEKIAPPKEGVHYPRCTGGKRHSPLEDIGGIWGYANFLEAIQDPDHPGHADMLEWADEDFDPEAFDRDDVNAALQHFS